MRIAVVSDSHGDISFFIDKMKEIKGVDRIIHLGDYDSDGHEINRILDIPTDIVAGNNDYGSKDASEKILNIEGHKIYLTHGHKYNVYFGIDRLVYKGLELGADLVMYGHTHRFIDETDQGVRVINPGSPSSPRGNDKASFIILDISKEEIKLERITREEGNWFKGLFSKDK